MNKTFIFLLFLSTQIFAGNVSILAVTNCPYFCESTQDKKGYVIDIFTNIFEKENYKVSYTSVDTQDIAMRTFTKGKFDLILGLNSFKSKGLLYSDIAMLNSRQVIITRNNSKWTYTSTDSFETMKIAYLKDLHYEPEVLIYLTKYQDNAKKVQGESGTYARKHNLKKLRYEKVNALIDDKATLKYFYFKKKKNFPFKTVHSFKPRQLKLAFNSQSYKFHKYTKIITKGLKRLDSSSELPLILKEYGLNTNDIKAEN